jgi:integrase
MHLRKFADHYCFPWLSADEAADADRIRAYLERAYPHEVTYAVTILQDKVDAMLRVLDSPELAGNLWALMMAALITLAHGSATRTREPTHALLEDLTLADEGIILAVLYDKTHKKGQDPRFQSRRVGANPGSTSCAVARMSAYLRVANLGKRDLLFPRRDITTGAVVRDGGGSPSLFTDYYYKQQLRAIALQAGIPDAHTLSPRGLRAGGATDDVLAGLPETRARGKGGWTTKTAFQLYNRGNELTALAVDAAARTSTITAASSGAKRQKTLG